MELSKATFEKQAMDHFNAEGSTVSLSQSFRTMFSIKNGSSSEILLIRWIWEIIVIHLFLS